MKTLIVPCAGKSSRFPNMKPKWMLTHPNGKLMVEEAISGLPLGEFDRIIITIVKEHSEKHEAKLVAEQVFTSTSNKKLHKKVEILELDNFTKSQSETVYETLIKKKVKGEFVVKDSDNYIKVKKCSLAEFIVGLDVNKFPKEIYRMKSKSFLMVNNQGIITDIIEKKISSEYICLGVYGFDDPQKFIKAYEFLSKDSGVGEIYISHIISYLIGAGKSVYSYIAAEEFEDWGTIQDWRNTQNRHAAYFIDIDGVILENRGRYGKENWSNSAHELVENLAVIKKLYDNGAQIIFTTSRDEKSLVPVKKILKKYGIVAHSFVTDCHHSPRIIINDFAPTNPHPSCNAVNIPRNGSLANYLEIK